MSLALESRPEPPVPPPGGPDGAGLAPEPAPVGPVRTAVAAAAWLLVAVVCTALVLFGLEPLFQQRTQQGLADRERLAISHAANEAQGLPGVQAPSRAASIGAPVGILEIPRLRLQQVVVAGAGPAQTQKGPGQVAGTAGFGQPGNTAVVGRRSTFGAPFADLGRLRTGDQILVSTTQGQSVYRVRTVRTRTGGVAGLSAPTRDNRLTLYTSARSTPWNADAALVVEADLQGRPFAPTVQPARAGAGRGNTGDVSAWLTVLVVVVGLAAGAAAAVVAYRRSSLRVAYLVTAAPLLLLVVLAAESVSRLLPAWT